MDRKKRKGTLISLYEIIKSRKRELLLFGISSVIGILLCLVFLEIFFQKENWNDSTIQFDPYLGWANKPNSSVVIDDKKYTTNSLGFRSEEVDFSKDHILLIGDSVTWGHGVNDNETVSYYLNQKYENYQVINLGVNGYGLDQYYLNLERNIGALNTKFIIVNIFTGNDFGDTITDTSYGKNKPLFSVDESKLKLTYGEEFDADPNKLKLMNDKISRYSCANLTTKRIWKQWSLDLHGFRNFFCEPQVIGELESLYVVLALLIKIRDLARQNNSGLLFVISPHKKDFEPQNAVAAGHLKYFQDVFQKMRFRYIDFYKEIRKQEWDVESLYYDGLHLSPTGNQILANTIYDFIESNSSIR